MRITGGKSKGRVLSSLKGMHIRPTSDKVREAVFDILGQSLGGKKILDLFAGTGSYGIEALSRGATWSLFIDNSGYSMKNIHKNLMICGFQKSGFVLKRDLRRGLPRAHPKFKEGFDIVFIDPPYGRDLIPPILEGLSGSGILTSHSLVIAESLTKDILPVICGKLRKFDTRIYGKTKIDMYSYEGHEDGRKNSDLSGDIRSLDQWSPEYLEQGPADI